MGIMEGSSLRIMLGTYSALGTFDDINWKKKHVCRTVIVLGSAVVCFVFSLASFPALRFY